MVSDLTGRIAGQIFFGFRISWQDSRTGIFITGKKNNQDSRTGFSVRKKICQGSRIGLFGV